MKKSKYGKCLFFRFMGACLIVHDNVGITSTSIYCQNRLEIGNHVLIGADTIIMDNNFHSIDYRVRSNRKGRVSL